MTEADIELDEVESEEESDDLSQFTTRVELGKRPMLTLNLAPQKKPKPLMVNEKVKLIHKLEYSPSQCTYGLLEAAGWLDTFCAETARLKRSPFHFLDQCKCTDHTGPKEALLKFRANTFMLGEASVVQAMAPSVVHLVDELNLVYGSNTFVSANEWPVGTRRRTDLVIFRIKNLRTYVIIEVKETIPVNLQKSEVKKVLPQLIYEMVLISTNEKACPGTKYLGIICDDYSFHSFVLTMNTTTIFEEVAKAPMKERPFSLSEYTSSTGEGGKALEPLCRVVQSFVQATTPPPTE